MIIIIQVILHTASAAPVLKGAVDVFVSKIHAGEPRTIGPMFPPEREIVLMFHKSYTRMSDEAPSSVTEYR